MNNNVSFLQNFQKNYTHILEEENPNNINSFSLKKISKKCVNDEISTYSWKTGYNNVIPNSMKKSNFSKNKIKILNRKNKFKQKKELCAENFLKKENSKLNSELNVLSNQIDELYKKNNKLYRKNESTLERLNKKNNLIANLETAIVALQQDKQQLTNSLISFNRNFELIQTRNNGLKEKIKNLKAEKSQNKQSLEEQILRLDKIENDLKIFSEVTNSTFTKLLE